MPDWETDSFRYLNTTYALLDLKNFVEFQNSKMLDIPNKKWVSIGGSYPGALSAWFRSKYPDTIYAAWSSSGVINPALDYDGYDRDVFESTSKSGLCAELL